MQKTRARSISHLKPGDNVELLFHGSRQFGNDPYQLDASFVGFSEDGNRAVFHLDGDTDSGFEAYKSGGRWCYGTSAERLSIVRETEA